MRCADEMSAMWQTGHSEETHSPDECAKMVVRRKAGFLIDIGRLDSRDLMLGCRLFRMMSNPLESERSLRHAVFRGPSTPARQRISQAAPNSAFAQSTI